MDERESARAEIDDSRERMKDIAAQLAHRANPTYVKQRAKEAAVDKSMELKDRMFDSPLAWGIVGGLATAGIATVVLGQVAKRAASRDESYSSFEGDEGGISEKVREAKSQLGEKVGAVKEQAGHLKQQAGHLKDQAMEQVGHLRDHIPSGRQMKDKAHQLTDRARGYAGDEPLISALGALAIGAALGFLLPLSDPERRMLAPAREQVSAKLDSLSSEVSDKVQAKVDEVRDKIAGESQPSA